MVFDNGPVSGNIGGWEIDSVAGPLYFVSDSFTVSAPTSLASVTAGLWVSAGSAPTSLQWQIGTTSGGNQISSGTSSLSDILLGLSGGVDPGFDVYESTFAINGTVGAGTYYLTLKDAQATGGSSVDWDQNNGPASALVYYPGGSLSEGSESFQVYDATVPEPSTWFAGVMALLALAPGAFRNLRRRITA